MQSNLVRTAKCIGLCRGLPSQGPEDAMNPKLEKGCISKCLPVTAPFIDVDVDVFFPHTYGSCHKACGGVLVQGLFRSCISLPSRAHATRHMAE